MEQQITHNYSSAIQIIKRGILKSPYRAASLANKELLSLYFGIGKYISENSRNHFWGTNAIETISLQLQQELPELRGFSISNLKNMRQFYEDWEHIFINRQPVAGEMGISFQEIDIKFFTTNCQPAAGDLTPEQINVYIN